MSEKKKILFVINSMVCGGAEKSLISLLPLIDYSKYSVDLQMFNRIGDFLDLVPQEVNILDDVSFFDFLSKGLIDKMLYTKKSYLFSYLKNSISIRLNKKNHPTEIFWKACRKSIDKNTKKYDVAIAWGQGNPTHYVAEKVNAEKKIAWINVNYKDSGHKIEFDRKYYKCYKYIVAVSNKLELLLKKQMPEFSGKLITIADIQNSQLINKMSKLENVTFDTSVVNIVTVARLTKQKGHCLAVEAGRILKTKGIKFKWCFVGDGPEKVGLKKQIEDNNLCDEFLLVGTKNNPYPYILGCDIYVQTSIYEGYCLTLAEARILNKPIVTTNFDVVHEQIIDGENGLIVDIDANSIADGIIKLLNNVDLRNNLINNLNSEKKGNIEELNKFYNIVNNGDNL